ncbi:RNA-directed DNA polymerase, eukaryota [Tanacetum coccineum]
MDILIVVVYAPHDVRDKRLLWDYLSHVSNQWAGEVVMMGDFNEVRYKSDRFGSNFNAHGADIFNNFIINAGLEEVPLGGSAYTWCHKSASKMSKLDRFLVSENLLNTCPNISAITLDRFLSDHRPILLREASFDYGPTPFWFFHFWFDVDGFDKFVTDSWKDAPGDDSNAMRNLCGKLKFLKVKIRAWYADYRNNSKGSVTNFKEELRILDELIDKGNGSDEIVNNRLEILGLISSGSDMPHIDMLFPNSLRLISRKFLECMVPKEESQKGVWIAEQTNHRVQMVLHLDFIDTFGRLLKTMFLRRLRWIQSCLKSSKGSIIVNGSPTDEFQFFKGLKQGDPLSPFLFILVMESLHISFQRVVDVGMFTGIKLSLIAKYLHLFYADDGILGQWNDSNIDTLVHVMECFYRVSGLRINLCKSKIMGIHVDADRIKSAASKLGCLVLNTPFLYLECLRPFMVLEGVGSLYVRRGFRSTWTSIVQEVKKLQNQGVLKDVFPRLYALERHQNVTIHTKLIDYSLVNSFRRNPRSGVGVFGEGLSASDCANCFPLFTRLRDEYKSVPLKVKNHGLKIKWMAAPLLAQKISSWWNVDYVDVSSYEEWYTWLVSLRLQANLKVSIVYGGRFGCSVTQIIFEKDTFFIRRGF